MAYSVNKPEICNLQKLIMIHPSYSIARSDPLMKLHRLDDVLLPTHALPVDKVGGDKYFNRQLDNGFCGIAKFSTEYHMVGGINAPKKLSCLGTDGKSRPQLLKGRDDLRQDAVMQQVFGLIDTLLKQSVPTSKLGVRTFKGKFSKVSSEVINLNCVSFQLFPCPKDLEFWSGA